MEISESCRKKKTKRTSITHKSVANEICLGKYYMVKRWDSTWLPGEVVSKRLNKKTKNNEYYVNYLPLDRRLDEWVKGYRIETSEYKGPLYTLTSLPTRSTDSDTSLDLESDEDEREHKELTKVKMINTIQFGTLEIDTWYYSPYPQELGDITKLFVCNKCFKYMVQENSYICHGLVCKDFSQPPGKIVYQNGKVAIFEVDGVNSRLYCQNLSLLGKLFIDHKTLCYDIESFLFYILCCKEDKNYIIRGYFSKEKDTSDGYNLSCIMTLPPFQNQGFGKLLIDFSYKISIIEGSPGSPEDPISDLGLFTYKSYWTWAILSIFQKCELTITLDELSKKTGISKGDIIYTLESHKLLGYWKGSNDVIINLEKIKSIILSDKFKKPKLTIDDSLIDWKSYTCLYADK